VTVIDVSASGVYKVAFAGKVFAAPEAMLKLPAKPGDTWTVDYETPPHRDVVTATYTVGKVEDVEVPAGKFKAIRVESNTTERLPGSSTSWYAPGVGLVKWVSPFRGVEQTLVLRAYTRGK
jgi:hypothetical protein